MSYWLPTSEGWTSLAGSHVLVRVDFNTPLVERDGSLQVTDDFRIRAALPLFQSLMARGAHVTACTHLGRPGGHFDAQLSVAPVRQRLTELCPGVELMENLRFDPGEESNDEEFGRLLVKGFDYYINEAFGVSHRAHASVMAPPRYLPSAAGPNLLTEVTTLLGTFQSPDRPVVAVLGGAKIADKLRLLQKLATKVDQILVGGAMAFTFWRALGHNTGDSLVDSSNVEACRELLDTGKIVVPSDAVVLRSGAPFGHPGCTEDTRVVTSDIPSGFTGLDLGPASSATFARILSDAATIVWNGPMGVFEDPRFAAGTRAVAEAIAASSATSLVGGGDSGAALAQFGLCDQVTYISTGGGASLELLELGDLPGLRALRECPWNHES